MRLASPAVWRMSGDGKRQVRNSHHREGRSGRHPATLRTAKEASAFLLNSWPGKRSPKHRAALQACSDAMSGEKPVMSARRAFIAAAREVNVFINDKD